MRVIVHRINIPAMSTIATGWGKTEDGRSVTFHADHRPARDIGEAIAAAKSVDELPRTNLEDYQVAFIEARVPPSRSKKRPFVVKRAPPGETGWTVYRRVTDTTGLLRVPGELLDAVSNHETRAKAQAEMKRLLEGGE